MSFLMVNILDMYSQILPIDSYPGSIKKFHILYKYIGKLPILPLYILLLVGMNTVLEINKTTFS